MKMKECKLYIKEIKNWVAQKQVSIDRTRVESKYLTVNQNYYCQSLYKCKNKISFIILFYGIVETALLGLIIKNPC